MARSILARGALALALTPGAGCHDDQVIADKGFEGPAPLKVNGPLADVIAMRAFTFPAGIKALGTTAATTVTFTSGAAATIAAGGSTATTSVRFGSCIFTVVSCAPTCPAGLAPAATRTIDPCTLYVTSDGGASLALGTDRSATTNIGTVTIACTGTTCTVTINGHTLSFFPPTGSLGG